MIIRWLGHASFLIQGEDLRIITDPYDPSITRLKPVEEKADIVLRSSDDDMAHCYIDSIPAGYSLLTATDYVDEGKNQVQIGDTLFRFMPSRESLIHKEVPRENAFYRFALEGIQVAHMGDVGNALSENQLKFLEGTEILIAPTGGPPTIDLDDLIEVVRRIQPRIVIPMHFKIPGPRFTMLPVEEFTKRFSGEKVITAESSSLEISRQSLPEEMRIIVLKPSLVKGQ
ncbi:MBL fold metallo-hydrolase [Marispirochaeta aestuarii]|uniref:MBL fold metallo-hydrolase n=1 Tax=Marispirochaeta aestuarii TaxID=1963862 RepID=UPI0029C9A2D4|nr:MBL fold metallo-hydrolase [Marispirochaeta aestuarii]